MNKENLRREPKNKNKVPITPSNRTSKNLVTTSTQSNPSNSTTSTPSDFKSLRRLKSSNVVTSTPKDNVATSSGIESDVEGTILRIKSAATNSNNPKDKLTPYKNPAFINKNKITLAIPTSTLGLTHVEYDSYEEGDLLETKDVIKVRENNNNIENRNYETKTEDFSVDETKYKYLEESVAKSLKNLQRNTVSKQQKIVKRADNISGEKRDFLKVNRNEENVHRRNTGIDGLFYVKRRDRRDNDGRKTDKVKVQPKSTLSVNLVRSRPKSNQASGSLKPRPISVPASRHTKGGHAKDSSGRDTDNISRTSSVTNLESLESQQGRSKGPPKKSGSKERVDKDGKRGAPKTNNNQGPQNVAVVTQQSQFLNVDPRVTPGFHSYSSDSLQDAEIQQLRRQLKEMADEKSSLALQLGEQRGQLNSLHKEILKLKCFQDESTQEIEKLSEENTTLRNRLRDVAHSPLSDNEKQQLLFENAHMMQSSSAPASIATNVLDDAGGDVTTCTTPDWDKHSSSNASEVSVACLQDKINQMQETHYSTNEELQATLQELTDLQRQLTDLQQENERLNEEKTLMFDSLCRQTERLNDSRQEVESLKQLLYRDRSDETAATQLENVVEREQKLVELLRSAQEEREALLMKLEQIQAELHESRSELIDKTNLIGQLSERVKTLECSMDAKHAEHKQMDQELAQAKDQCSSKQIEINRMSDLLENARTKINELEQDRTLSDKSELDELLDNARKEKDQLESEVAYLKEQLARSKNEIEKLKEQVFVLQEECKVTRNNAKSTQSDLEYKCEKLVLEKTTLTEQLQQFQEGVNELQVQTQCHIEDKRQLSAVLSETQRNLSEMERKSLNFETELQELKKLRAEENDEWEKFQNDLLTSVRVANDFKTEAQQELQKIILENKTYREKVRLLEGQLEKLKGGKTTTESQTEVVLTPQLIHLAKNFDFPTSKVILREESKRRHKKVVSLDSANMDKLFPALSKERRSKSKESLDKIRKSHESLHESVKPGPSQGHLTKSQEELSKKPKKSKFKLFGGKSTENLTDSEALYDQESVNRDKLKKSRFKFGKSNENLSNFEKEFHKDLQKAEPDKAPKKSEKMFEKPRKKSKDSTDSLSSSDTLEKKNSDFFSRFVKRRDKKPQNRNFSQHPKFMSVEEELLMESLGKWYENIDKTVPDDMLSKEDKAVKKLKILYENEQLKERPVANKPKDQLAISKPLLTSVVQNPKLQEIVKNRDVPNIEEHLRDSVLEYEDQSSAVQKNVDIQRPRIKSDGTDRSKEKKWFNFHKSRSLDNLEYYDVEEVTDPYGLKLYRTTETENLNTNDNMLLKRPKFELQRYSSEIQPYNSVSNPRHSEHPQEEVVGDRIVLPKPDEIIELPETNQRHPDGVFLETFPHSYESKIGNELPKPNIYINYENLDQIVAEIPKNVPETSLSEEQKFAIKLKTALDEAEKKTGVKKRKKRSLKNMEISPPTKESVEKNWKLKEIISNPKIKNIQDINKRFSDFYVDSEGAVDQTRRHSANIEESFEVIDGFSQRTGVERRPSKSYQDITFNFAPENHILEMFYPPKTRLESDSSTTSNSYTSGEFNLDTGKVLKTLDESAPLTNTISEEIQGKEEVHDSDSKSESPITNVELHVDVKIKPNDLEDLLYNETLSKKEKRKSLEPTTDDLGYNETLVKKVGPKTTKIDIVEQDPKIKEAEIQYKKDLKEILHRMKVEEKIKPFLHPRVPKHKIQVLHVHYQEPESILNVYNKDEAIIGYTEGVKSPTDGENVEFNKDFNENVEENNHSFLSYRSSDISKFLESSSDSLVLPDSSRDFLHSSGFADQDSKNIFMGLSNNNTSLENFLEEERKAAFVLHLDAKNNFLINTVEPADPLEDLNVNINLKHNLIDSESHIVNEDKNNDLIKNNDQYTYQEMIKENKYGVTSPYEVRYSYKNVVTEIKRKFSEDDLTVPDYLKEGKAFNSENKQQAETFMDRFYNNHAENEEGQINNNDKKDTDDEPIIRSKALSQIDKEMQDIMEKYINTRASLLVKKNFNTEPQNAKEKVNYKSNLKKYDNLENLHEIKISDIRKYDDKSAELDYQDLKFIEEMKQKYSNKNELQHVVKENVTFPKHEIKEKYDNKRDSAYLNDQDFKFIGEMEQTYADKNELQQIQEKYDNKSDSAGLDDQDLKFIEEMKGKYANKDEPEQLQEKYDDKRYSAGLDDKHLQFIDEMNEKYVDKDKLKQMQEKYDNKKDIGGLNDQDFKCIEKIKEKYTEEEKSQHVPKEKTAFTEREIQEKYENLSEEEINLIKSVKKDRFSRPLSEINETDILLIEEISKRYFEEDSRSESVIDGEDKIINQNIESKEDDNVLKVQDLPDLVRTAHELQVPTTLMQPVVVKKQDITSSKIPELKRPETLILNQEQPKASEIHHELKLPSPPIESPKILSPLSPMSDTDPRFSRSTSNQEFKTSSLKKSLIPLRSGKTQFGSLPPNMRKNKINISLGNHFQRRSLDVGLNYQPVYGTKSKSLDQAANKIKSTDIEVKYKDGSLIEPVYENILSQRVKPIEKSKLEITESFKTEKRPIPRPRVKSQSSFSGLMDYLPDTEKAGIMSKVQNVKNDINCNKYETVVKMTESNRNSCEENSTNKKNDLLNDPKQQNDKLLIPNTSVSKEKQVDPKSFEVVKAKVVYLDESESIFDLVPEAAVREKELDIVKVSEQEGMSNDTQSSSKSSLPSKSSIKIMEKQEQLDITKNLTSTEGVKEIARVDSRIESSRVNLFNLESEHAYDSYLELFKSDADKQFDNITGKQTNRKGFVRCAIVGDESEDSYTDDSKMSVVESTPKIIDFVPLDDKTEPYFTKGGMTSVNSTLERENTFQVLNQAKSFAKINTEPKFSEKAETVEEKAPAASYEVHLSSKEVENLKNPENLEQRKEIDKSNKNGSIKVKSSIEMSNTEPKNVVDRKSSLIEVLAKTPSNFSKASSKSQTDASRTSFSNAKKLFEALSEANKTEEKLMPKTPPKYQVKDVKSPGKGAGNRDSIGGNSKNIIRETVLLLKDGQSVPLEPKSSKNIVRETLLIVKDGKNVPLSPENKK